jgi:uncharacterized protein
LRRRHAIGVGGLPVLAPSGRTAPGSEYAPLLQPLAAKLSHALTATWLHVAGTLFVAGRVLHAVGLTRSAGTSPGRSLGWALAWLTLLGFRLVLIPRTLSGVWPAGA